MTKKDGGPAFPMYTGNPENWVSGLSLRDYFAGQALAGMPDHLRELQTDHRIKIAQWAYGLADAMIAEREK